MSQLHRTIALSLIRKRARLTPLEIRYLRKSVGWSGKDFAERFHVDPATVSRWEREDEPQRMEIGYELALRLAVAHGEQIAEYDVADLGSVASKEAAPVKMALTVGENGWHADIAEAA
jgi:DNA-binding transcriptional regulator YiaG